MAATEPTDPRYRRMAEAALRYAENEYKDELKRLRAENAALKKRAAAAATAGGGHGPADSGGDATTWPRLAVRRARTLAVFLGLLSVTTKILETYEHTLAAHVSLAFYVPFLIGHGGNCGGMSVGAVISALARGAAPAPRDRAALATREILGGLGVALQLSALAAVVFHVVGADRALGAVVVAALGGITVLSATLGAVAPLLLDAAGLDAATVAPPAVTTLIDALGIMMYLTLAQAMLGVGGAAPPVGRGPLGEEL